MRQFLITLFIFLLAGCNKYDNDTYNKYNITDFTYEEEQEQTKLFTRQIAQNYIIIKDIVYLIFRQSIIHPEIFGMLDNPNQAQVRTCPTSGTTGSFPGTVDLTLDFGGTTGCTTTGLSPAQNTYTGSIKGEFKTELFSNISGEEFTLSTCGFSINGYQLTDVNIEFYKRSGSSTTYDIKLLDDLEVTKGNIKTSIAKNIGSERLGNLKYVPDANDMDDDPLTFLDNEFKVFIGDNTITCENTATMTSTDYCVDTTTDLLLQPSTCGCLKDGKLRISNDGDCNNPHTEYLFDSDPSGANPNPGECDEYVEEVTSTGTVNIPMDSC